MHLKLYKIDNIVDNYAQDGFSYRFHSDLENISCEFTDMETISNTNSSIYTSDTCMVLTNSPQNMDDSLFRTGHYSVSRGTKVQKNMKCTVGRNKKN